MLNEIAHSSVVVKSESREFSRKFTLLDLFGEWRVVKAGSRDQVLRQLGLHDSPLDQVVEGMETRRFSALGIALCLSGVVLEGCDLSLDLLVELFQLLLITEHILTIERLLLRSRSDCSCCSFICSFIL